MRWSEVCIHTTSEAMEPIANILHEADVGGLVIEDPLDLVKERSTFFGEIYELNPNKYPIDGIYMKIYLPVDHLLENKIEEIRHAIDQLLDHGIDLGANKITQDEINEVDWETAWKKYYKPVKISERITIVPTWEEYKISAHDELIIELDPGMAFGTGTHPTTVLSIRALEDYVTHDDLVIDVGCGSGVLSIAAGLLGARKVHAYDLDDIAVKSTALNVELNHLQDKIIAKPNNLLHDIDVEADIIVSNILAEIIVKFVQDAWNNLKPAGFFITSGIIDKKKQLVIDELEHCGFNIIEINEIENWVCIVAQKL